MWNVYSYDDEDDHVDDDDHDDDDGNNESSSSGVVCSCGLSVPAMINSDLKGWAATSSSIAALTFSIRSAVSSFHSRSRHVWFQKSGLPFELLLSPLFLTMIRYFSACACVFVEHFLLPLVFCFRSFYIRWAKRLKATILLSKGEGDVIVRMVLVHSTRRSSKVIWNSKLSLGSSILFFHLNWAVFNRSIVS